MTIEAEPIRSLAPAKINLFLHVGDKRLDGFHALQSLVAFTRAGDELLISPDRELKLVIRGPFGEGLSAGEDNLITKAARALAARGGVESTRGAYLSLKKNLPVASGIGGGSADCAATLRGLAKLWGLKLSTRELCEIGATLGSDVPVCIASQAQYMEGRGEKVTALPALPPMAILLINPGVAVPTGKVFAALKERSGVGLPVPPKFASKNDLLAYLAKTSNDLEAPARVIAPVISEVLNLIALQGALLERMSGSGATCFGLFESDDAAHKAARMIQAAQPKWWVTATKIAAFTPQALLD